MTDSPENAKSATGSIHSRDTTGTDPVHHPKHYTNHPSGVECITVTEHMNFNLGNAVKYIWRAGEKGNLVQDLEKARWYIDREITRIKARQVKPSSVTGGVTYVSKP